MLKTSVCSSATHFIKKMRLDYKIMIIIITLSHYTDIISKVSSVSRKLYIILIMVQNVMRASNYAGRPADPLPAGMQDSNYAGQNVLAYDTSKCIFWKSLDMSIIRIISYGLLILMSFWAFSWSTPLPLPIPKRMSMGGGIRSSLGDPLAPLILITLKN